MRHVTTFEWNTWVKSHCLTNQSFGDAPPPILVKNVNMLQPEHVSGVLVDDGTYQLVAVKGPKAGERVFGIIHTGYRQEAVPVKALLRWPYSYCGLKQKVYNALSIRHALNTVIKGTSSARVEKTHPIGSRIGRLTVRGFRNVKRRWHVECECDCGNKVCIRPDAAESCGCLQREAASKVGKRIGGWKLLPTGEASFRFLLREYRSGAEARKLNFELTSEHFKSLTKQNCFYCGCPPSKRIAVRVFNGAYAYNGVDRVDNSKGYTPDNSVPCCTTCNIAKQRMSPAEFISWAKRVVEHSETRDSRPQYCNLQ